MLMDKKSTRSSIKRIYQLMLTRGEIYKLNKHKNNFTKSMSGSFTSKLIEDSNVYDLNHAQISQLVQDLIRNDISIKSKNAGRTNSYREDDYTRYFEGNTFVYNSDDLIDEYDDEYEQEQIFKGIKSKFERKYDYMFDERIYELLLHRGLEYIDPIEFQEMLGNSKQNNLTLRKK